VKMGGTEFCVRNYYGEVGKMAVFDQNSPFSGAKGTYSQLRGRPRMWEVFSVQNGDLLVLKRGSGGFCVSKYDGQDKKHHGKVKKQGILTQQPTGLLASMAATRGGGWRRRKWCCCGARRVGKGRRRKIPLSGCFVEGGSGSSLVSCQTNA
jgi:hypothetical protein